jgi:hypothetical protein
MYARKKEQAHTMSIRLAIAALAAVLLAAVLLTTTSAQAQFFGPQTTITTPSHNISDSFYERNGIDFDFDIGGFKFRQGSFDATVPSVGGFTSDRVGANGGFKVRKGKNRARVRYAFGQGSNRTHSMQAPVITVANGQQGFVTNTTQIPFVTNVIPVVNDWRGGGMNYVAPNFASAPGYGAAPVTSMTPYYGNATAGLEARMRAAALAASREGDRPRRKPRAQAAAQPEVDKHTQRLDAARGSSAGQPAPSVASIRAAQADAGEADQSEALSYYRRGQQAEEQGKIGIAKIYYRNALQTARGKLRDEIEARQRAIKYRK